MRLFLYGTLMDPAMLARRSGDASLPARCVPAFLPGWRRVGLRGGRWPTLRQGGAGVTGLVVDVPAAALRRLAAYEGPAYRLTRVVVSGPAGRTPAWTWIASGGTHRPWPA